MKTKKPEGLDGIFSFKGKLGADHHFLPEFYLKAFTDPDTPLPKHEPFLWLYKFEERRWRKRSPKNVATKKDLYVSTTEWGEKHDLLEQSLGLLETSAAPLIRDKIERTRPLSPADREIFAAFVAESIVRTPASMELMADVYTFRRVQEFAKQVERWIERPEEWVEFKTRFNEANPEQRLSEGLKADDIHPKRFKIQPPRPEEMNAISLAASWVIFPVLMDMGWAFFRAEPPLYYMTSDNPCARIVPDRDSGGPFPAGLDDPKVEVSFPVTKTQFFVGSRAWKGITYRLADRDFVAQMNKRTLRFSKSFIAAPKPGFPGSVEILRIIQSMSTPSPTSPARE